MQFSNSTSYKSALLRTSIDDDRLLAAVCVRITYDIAPTGNLVRCEEQSWDVSGDAVDTPYGQLEGEPVFRREGVDFFVFGNAYARAKGVTRGQVVLELNRKTLRQVTVTGDRVWQRIGRKLVPSAPAPFTTVPLDLGHAYGGAIVWDGLKVPYPDNPDGKGYCASEQEATGQPLPNIEESDQLVEHWDDHPIPAGFGLCSMQSPLRLRNAIKLDEQGMIEDIWSGLFQRGLSTHDRPSGVARGRRPTVGCLSRWGAELQCPVFQSALGGSLRRRSCGTDSLLGADRDRA
jgi:hypothetical protein